MKAGALALLAFAAPALASAQPAQLRFVTCPVYRDTDAGKKSGLVGDGETS